LPQHHTQNNADTLRILESSQLPELLHGLTLIKKSDLDPERLSKVFSKIFDMYKSDYDTNSRALLLSPGFKNCCSILRSHAPRMMVNDLIICLKVLVSLKLNAHNKLIQQLLYHIKEEINELSLTQLAFVNYLLTKMEKTPLANALVIAIPIVFDLNISIQLDHENPEELHKLLHHALVSNMKLSDKSITSILAALILHGTSFDFECAFQIVRSLTSQNAQFIEKNEIAQRLLQNCIHVLTTKYGENDFTKMEIALDKLVKRYYFTNHDSYYNETFFNKCAQYVIDHDLGFDSAYHVLKRFNQIHFVNYDLLKYIDQQIITNPAFLSTMKMGPLMNLISCFSTANYRSENWDIIKSILHENPVWQGEINIKFPILKWVAEMLSVDFISKIFLDRVLALDFLAEYLNRNSANNFANLPQLRTINQTLTLLHPEYDGILPDKLLIDMANASIPSETAITTDDRLTSVLETIFGKDAVQKNMQTKNGHLLEYTISFDNEKAIVMPCRVKYVEDLPKNQVKSVSVYFHARKNSPINYPVKLRGVLALRKRTLEKIGVKEIDIALHCLELLPETERCGYVEREIRFALNH
jgi:FAST kinase domain-containing protein 2